jgi:hypothetical protein
MRGWVQAYNAQAACNEQHLILAAEIMTSSPDLGHVGPMVTAARRELSAAGVTSTPQVIVADADYWPLDQMNEITACATCSPPSTAPDRNHAQPLQAPPALHGTPHPVPERRRAARSGPSISSVVRLSGFRRA